MAQAPELYPNSDRRQRLAETIDGLLAARQKVLVAFCDLAGVNSYEQKDPESQVYCPRELESFCQILVDYTALGHFEIYQRIIEGKERRVAVQKVAQEVYPAIAETTDYLVDFNDKYDDITDSDFSELKGDLSELGEIFAVRGELEDRLLSAMR